MTQLLARAVLLVVGAAAISAAPTATLRLEQSGM
jgi:hypothetical protein